jgi:hypothetical protein
MKNFFLTLTEILMSLWMIAVGTVKIASWIGGQSVPNELLISMGLTGISLGLLWMLFFRSTYFPDKKE